MLNSIEIVNYRNLSRTKVELREGINFLIRKNGFGKTNFLETIYISVFRRSFKPMIKFSEVLGAEHSFAKVESEWDATKLELVVTNTDKLQKKILLNSKSVALSSILKKFSIILFAPHSVDLVNGEPQIRRADLDDFLSNLKPEYSNLVSKYKVVLRNRNAVIKAISENKAQRNQLVYWTEEISKIAGQIFEFRNQFFSEIQGFIKTTSEEIYHDVENLTLNYASNVHVSEGQNAREVYLQKYQDNAEKEIYARKTLYGIHKDDYFFKYGDDKNLKYHGSRGQQRIGSFIVKMAQLKILESENRDNLILLIDDIMSELDDAHRKNISKYLVNLKTQILITGADIKEIPEEILNKGHKIEI